MATKIDITKLFLIIGILILVIAIKDAGHLPFVTQENIGTVKYSNCNLVRPDYATIRCELGGPNNFEVKDGEKISHYSADGLLSFVSVRTEGNLFCSPNRLINANSGSVLCAEYSISDKPCLDVSWPSTIPNLVETSGDLMCTDIWTIQYREKILRYYDNSNQGGVELAGTEGCVTSKLINNLRENNVDVVGVEDESNEIIGEYKVGQDVKNHILVGYSQTIPWTPHTLNGDPVYCDYSSKTVYSLKELTTWSTSSCYVAPAEIIKSNIQCCNPSQCEIAGVDVDMTCVDFECVPGTQSDLSCQWDSQCKGDNTLLTEQGVLVYEHFCNKDTHLCDKRFTGNIVSCDPDTIYPNDKYCDCSGSGKDLTCELKNTATVKKDCVATFGEDACCLDTQTNYSIHEAPSDKECCYVRDGVGKIRDHCRESITSLSDLLRSIGDSFADAMGLGDISETIGTAIGSLIMIGTVIFIIWLISIIFREGRIQGGFGGMGGGPVIVVR